MPSLRSAFALPFFLIVAAFLVSASFLGSASLRAQEAHPVKDTPPVNVELILRELDAIEKQRAQIVQSAKQATLFKLQSAAAGGGAAIDLYTQAIEAVNYEGMSNKVAAFNDWKNTNADLLRSHELQDILILHLRYLILSLQRAGSKDAEPFLGPALEYAKSMFDADTGYLKEAQRLDQITNNKMASPRDREDQTFLQKVLAAKRDLLDRSVADSVFSKWMRLDSWLPSPNDWELIPGNLSGILDKDLRPTLRIQKNVQLMDSWTFEMQFLANQASAGKLEHTEGDFDTVARPKLLFQRANDMVLLGWNNRAMGEIYSLVKTYPTHPDFDKWMDRLRELIQLVTNPPAAESTDSPAASSTPSDAASPGASPVMSVSPGATTTPTGIVPQ